MLAIDTRYRRTFAELGLSSFDSIAVFFGGQEPSKKTTVLVKPMTLDLADRTVLPVFYKQYEYSPASWAFIGRPSKARREFQNYEVFTRLGIACAERVACGEERAGFGRLRRAFIITRAIPEAMNLADFLAKHCPQRSSERARRLRHAICQQLAAMTKQIHSAGFFHHDLVWRNILVTSQPSGEPKLWWIDCPRGQFDCWSPWRHRRRLKDLASLDKSAAKYCSRSERAAFIKEYLGKQRLDIEAKQLSRTALAYRKQRWPEDWNER